MFRYVLTFVAGALVMVLALWLSCANAPAGAAEPTGYTLKDVYDFIVSNGGTNPVEGGHSLYPHGAPGIGGMPTISQIMEELRKRLPAQSGGGGALPATGQTACYDNDGNPIDCGSTAYPGQDGFYRRGCPTANRFVDNGDGTVTDHCTGLVWQKATAPGTYTWQEALQYCENLTLAGHNDWRLPNVRELQSILDYGRWKSTIDPVFGTTSDADYWSSSTYALNRHLAWYANFGYGLVYGYYKTNANYVRAVRG